MASDPSSKETADWTPIGRGINVWKQYINLKRGFAKLDPELRKKFPTDRDVNEALRGWLKSKKNGSRGIRKSA